MLVLFLGVRPKLSAMEASKARVAGRRFARMHPRDYVPVVGTSFPRAAIRDLTRWVESHSGRRYSRSDDHWLGLWHRESGQRILSTVPSLVEHPDDVTSLIGKGRGPLGNKPAKPRSALFFAE